MHAATAAAHTPARTCSRPALLPARPSDYVCARVPLPAERAAPGCTCEDSILRAGLCAQAHTSALGLLVLLASFAAPVSAAGTFTTKAELQAALELVVCDEDADALALYGAPGTWDVSAVTDMSTLIGGYSAGSGAGLSCKATFNEVRTFHVAQVGVLSIAPSAPHGILRPLCCGLRRSQAIGSWDVGSVKYTCRCVARRARDAHSSRRPRRCDAS